MSYLDIAKESLNRLQAEEPAIRGDGTEAEHVAGMKLSDFARAGLIVQVRSEVLETDVLFVSDNVPESRLRGRPEVVYRAHELKRLARVPPDPRGLRTVHMVKEIYGGTIQDVTDRKGQQEVRDAAKG